MGASNQISSSGTATQHVHDPVMFWFGISVFGFLFMAILGATLYILFASRPKS